ncbi:MAG: ABC transporter ATP-binding protein [Muribaculaceae bacterium]|nr:ABC transporter ATP-binding protein [Muribaculaceae bacterium]
MYRLENLSYEYGRGRRAVDNVTADIGAGMHLLVGENGAGKTTLLHLLGSLRFPDSGSCKFDGTDVALRGVDTLRRIFFMSDDFESQFSTIEQMARCHGQFYPDFSYELMYANLADFGLTGKEKLRGLSLGMRRKAYISYALALRTPVLLFDEPTNGMDISSKKLLRRILTRSVTDDTTVIISTHNVHDLDSLFENVMIMHRGRLRLCMPVWRILERIAFVSSASPIAGALYQEPDRGCFRAIIAKTDGPDTEIDYQLLYSAAMSPVGDILLDYINAKRDID